MEPSTIKEIERYVEIRKNQGLPINNEIVLIVLCNHILTIKDMKKDLQANIALVKDYQKQDFENKLKFFLDA